MVLWILYCYIAFHMMSCLMEELCAIFRSAVLVLPCLKPITAPKRQWLFPTMWPGLTSGRHPSLISNQCTINTVSQLKPRHRLMLNTPLRKALENTVKHKHYFVYRQVAVTIPFLKPSLSAYVITAKISSNTEKIKFKFVVYYISPVQRIPS